MLLNIDTAVIEDARRILMWLCFSMRPLTVPELIDAVAVELGDDVQLNRERRLHDGNDLLQICPGFISITLDSENQSVAQDDEPLYIVSIAHHSVQEYLESDRIRQQRVACFSMSLAASHVEIAQKCLLYLLDPTLSETEVTSDACNELPLLRYAARYWYQHVKGDESLFCQLQPLVIRLFENRDHAFRNWIVMHNPDQPWRLPFSQETDNVATPTYYSSLLGFYSLLSALLKIPNENAQMTGYGKTTLDKSADINVQGGRYGNALQAASYEGHEKIIQLLLNENASVNAQGGHFGSALQASSSRGHEKIVQLLLDKDADVNAQGGEYGSALQAASSGGHEKIVQLLLDKDADVNAQGGRYGSALQAALSTGREKIVQLLRDKGANCQLVAQGSDDHTVRLSDTQTGDSAAVTHEAGWEEDSDNLSDLSEVSSVQSLPSLMSDSSSASMRNKYNSEAAEHLAGLLSEDSVLTSMYEAAIAKLGCEKFCKNHDQLLKAFFRDLRSETQNSVQLATVRGLRSRDRRHRITLLIHNAFEPLNVYRQQAMTILKDQKPNRKQLLNSYLGEKTSVLQIGSVTTSDIDLEYSNIAHLEQDDESVDEGASSNSSADDNDRRIDQEDKEAYAYLEPLEKFITKSDAFARFSTNLGYLLHPPADLSEALKSRELHIVQRFLVRNFASAATSDFEWLHELDEAGYTRREIAELLLEESSDSPWIYFTLRTHVRHPIQNGSHVPGCAHGANFNTEPQSLLYSERAHSRSPLLHVDVRQQVEELCGIGGVVPSSRDVSTWHGNVTFEEQSSVSVVTYAAASSLSRQSPNDLVARISNVLANLCTAAAAVQSTGLCCDSFTVLLCRQNCLEIRRIELRHAREMEFHINLALHNDNREAAVQGCVQWAEQILQGVRMTIPGTKLDADLHYCALAAQFLCVAFLSYTQAHVGPLNPFFLDTPQRKVVLLGSQLLPGDFAIIAQLVELTCLAKMIQQPVLAFSSVATNRKLRLETDTYRCDVLTNAEDFLDTWGPGYFIYNKLNPSKIHAVAIGGGFVSLVNSKTSQFHWIEGTLPESASRGIFERATIMRIGTAVSINENCCIDEVACRDSSCCALEPLGTQEAFWEAQERQASFQGGQYFIGSYSQTWKKMPGTTLKQHYLQKPDWRLIDFLEQSWGLQVSFCTSVARRVSLRELVTDLLPIFVNPLEQDVWQQLVNGHNITQAFSQGNLFDWLRILSPVLQRYVLNLVRTILDQLQHTGLDRRNTTLVIAWPQEGDIGRGLRIPCKAETCWAQVIADAEDCATFAYVTPKCLETNHVKCQGSLRAWQNLSKMLVTEMSPSRPEGQPVTGINAANTTSPASVTTTAMATTQWELKDQTTYFIKKLDSLLRVKVERPSSTSNDVAHLVVATSKISQGLWKRLLLRNEERNHRIRERQATGDHAERVVIRAGLIRM
jgi:hypothetical protein